MGLPENVDPVEINALWIGSVKTLKSNATLTLKPSLGLRNLNLIPSWQIKTTAALSV
jgi:hypothetical protein